ncbi:MULTISPECIES: hypothetical protein [Jeotgalibacillus]|nr:MULTISPECIES: hypothetical protein [Jeotgalibacillus]
MKAKRFDELVQRLEEVAGREEKAGGIQNYFILGIGIAAIWIHSLL